MTLFIFIVSIYFLLHILKYGLTTTWYCAYTIRAYAYHACLMQLDKVYAETTLESFESLSTTLDAIPVALGLARKVPNTMVLTTLV